MDKQPSSAEKKSANEAKERIATAIFSIQPQRIEDFLRESYDLNLNAFTVGVQERDEIDILAKLACLGDEIAVAQLVMIGNRVSMILDYLTNLKPNKENEVHKSPYDGPSPDFSVTDDLSTLANAPIENLNEYLSLLRKNVPVDRFVILLDDLIEILKEPSEVLKRNLKGDEQSHTIPPGMTGNWDLVESICMALFNHRILGRGRKAAYNIASRSIMWPVRVSAIAEGRNEKFKQLMTKLKLGNALEIVVDPGPGRGKTRHVFPGSPMPFTLHIFTILHHEKNIHRSPVHLGEMNDPNYLRELETRFVGSVDDTGPSQTWIPEFYWRTLAALLPEFLRDRKSIMKWHEAAMKYAEWWCQGDFDEFSVIQCVRSRINKNQGENRSAKSSVSEILDEQLEKLAKNHS